MYNLNWKKIQNKKRKEKIIEGIKIFFAIIIFILSMFIGGLTFPY